MTARLSLRRLALPIALAVASACGDGRNENEGIGSDAGVLTPVGVTEAAVRARAALHERNRYEWLGRAHNKAIRDFTADVRKPGVLPSLCRSIANFSSHPDRLPKEKKHLAQGHDRSDLRSALEGELCAASTRMVSPGRLVGMWLPPSSEPTSLGPDTDRLLNDVQAAIATASNSYDLALRLSPILDAAVGLDTSGRAVVEVAVSVAQSSVENAESELASYPQIIAAEYGSCAQGYKASGYSLYDTQYLCTEGKDRAYETFAPLNPTAPARTAGIRPSLGTVPPACVGLERGWKRVGEADVMGAIAGFVAGLISTKNMAGAGVGALAGGVGKSVAEYFKVGWEMWWCVMT